MRPFYSLTAVAWAAVTLLSSNAALADAKLVGSVPAADAQASNVHALSLTFSETLVEKLSGVEIVMTGMPGMSNHQPMKIAGFTTSLGGDGKVLAVTFPRALPAGNYDVKWHAVAADTHRIEGGYSFSVK